MSRWAYPASAAMIDVSHHGSVEDWEENQEMMKEEESQRWSKDVIQNVVIFGIRAVRDRNHPIIQVFKEGSDPAPPLFQFASMRNAKPPTAQPTVVEESPVVHSSPVFSQDWS